MSLLENYCDIEEKLLAILKKKGWIYDIHFHLYFHSLFLLFIKIKLIKRYAVFSFSEVYIYLKLVIVKHFVRNCRFLFSNFS